VALRISIRGERIQFSICLSVYEYTAAVYEYTPEIVQCLVMKRGRLFRISTDSYMRNPAARRLTGSLSADEPLIAAAIEGDPPRVANLGRRH
jgi:hypothetical protein